MAVQYAESNTSTGVRHELGQNDDLYVARDVRSVSTNTVAVSAAGQYHDVQIFGSVFGYAGAIAFSRFNDIAGSNTIFIAETGQVGSRQETIALLGQSNSIVNHGEIASMGSAGIRFFDGIGDESRSNTVRNYGAITGARGIDSGSLALVLRNYGDITSTGALALSLGTGADSISNYGAIDGDIDLGGGSNSLVNRGTIYGNVAGGIDSDRIDNRGGTITGDIQLGEGADTFRPGSSEETVNGGTGNDTLDFSRSTGVQFALDDSIVATGVALNDLYLSFENLSGSNTGSDLLIGDAAANSISGNGGDDQLSGLAGDDLLEGGTGNDSLDGGFGLDRLFGDSGNDTLLGGLDNDTLYGGNGNDRLVGGGGKDMMYGGAGTDTFVFAKGDFGGATAATADIITDFSQSEGDRIDLFAIDANAKIAGDQAFAFIGAAAFGSIAGQLRVTQASGNTYVQGDTNGDGKADFAIALYTLITMKAADFVL